MRNLLINTQSKAKTKEFINFWLEVNHQTSRIFNQLDGIDWDNMTKAEQKIYLIITDGKKPDELKG